MLESESIKDFDNQKIKIVNELHFELIECLWTTRLRFGGELIQYISKIKIALLNLDTKEIELFEKIKTEPIHNYFPENFSFKSNKEKTQKERAHKKFSYELPDFETPEQRQFYFYAKYTKYANSGLLENRLVKKTI